MQRCVQSRNYVLQLNATQRNVRNVERNFLCNHVVISLQRENRMFFAVQTVCMQ